MSTSIRQNQAVVLFSGGCGSTLAAIRAGQSFERVHLLTCLTRGHSGLDRVREQVERLARFFGDQGKFVHRFIRTDRLLRRLLHERYFGNLCRHGFRILDHGGLSRLAFHFRALVYCRDLRIDRLMDGHVADKPRAVPGKAEWAVHRDECLVRPRLVALCAGCGVRLESPVLDHGPKVEETLYRVRFNPAPSVRGTPAHRGLEDRQLLMSAAVMRWYGSSDTIEGHERLMAGLYADKLGLIEAWTRSHPDSKSGSRLARLIEN